MENQYQDLYELARSLHVCHETRSWQDNPRFVKTVKILHVFRQGVSSFDSLGRKSQKRRLFVLNEGYRGISLSVELKKISKRSNNIFKQKK